MAQLQEKLAAFGYDPGPVDGRFGTLTEEAVFQLQADYHLRQDGIAGRQVAHLLGAGLPAALRAVHPAPGTRLVIPVRPVLVAVGDETLAPERLKALEQVLRAHRNQVTALVAPWFHLTPEGGVEGRVEPALWELASDQRLPFVARLRVAAPDGLVPTGRQRRQGLAELARAVARYHLPALYLAFDPLVSGERYPAAALATALRRVLPPFTLLHLEVPGPPASTGGDEAPDPGGEARALADLAEVDRLVLRFTGPPAETDRPVVRRLIRRHPSYRILLGLPAAGYRADLTARLSLVTRLALAGVVLWEVAAGQEAVFRAMADLFSVQGSQAWAAGRRNIHEPQA